jgi:hypothetical protein
VITPAGVETGPVPMDVAPAPEQAPDAKPASVDEPTPVDEPAAETTVDAVEADTADTSETDLDADNYPDYLEVEIGLDPTTIDTDGDGVADGDEGNLYGTDPTVFDSDVDGVSDGGELFDLRTDPLVWNDFAAESVATAPLELRRVVPRWPRKASLPVPRVSTAMRIASLTLTRRTLPRTRPARIVTAMATTTATR